MDSTAKQEWLQTYQGATLRLEPEFGSPKVNHMFQRNFDHMGRNAFFISVRGRITLGEEQVSQAEQYIYDRINEITKALDRKIEAAKAVMLDAGITVLASYNRPMKQEAVIVSPMQTRYIKLLQKADELLMYMNTLMLYGEIPERELAYANQQLEREMAEREHSKRELEIKQHMRTVPSTIRKMTIGLRNRLTEVQAKEAAKAPAKEGAKAPEAANEDSIASSSSEAPAQAAPVVEAAIAEAA